MIGENEDKNKKNAVSIPLSVDFIQEVTLFFIYLI
jgi:hypothetical protein